jgi:hypothetical protein
LDKERAEAERVAGLSPLDATAADYDDRGDEDVDDEGESDEDRSPFQVGTD